MHPMHHARPATHSRANATPNPTYSVLPFGAVGALDVAVVILAIGVAASLGLLAWTLGVSAVVAVRRERDRVVEARLRIASSERRLREAGAASREAIGRLNQPRRREPE